MPSAGFGGIAPRHPQNGIQDHHRFVCLVQNCHIAGHVSGLIVLVTLNACRAISN
jgi:hypothetical protein